MKTLRLFLIASFIVSLLAGLWAGKLIFKAKQNIRQTSSHTKGISTKPGEQEGIWLIVVDQLNSSTPQLEGIWLFVYITNYMTVKPLPLFPSDNPERDAELAKVFHLTSDDKITPAFWDYLKAHGYPVRDYIIFDEIAAAGIINYYGGVNIQGNHLNGLEALTQTPKSWEDPIRSLQNQIAIMDSLCKSVFNSQPAPDLYKLQEEVNHHLLSNLDLSKKSKEWQKLIASGNHKVCDIPELYEKMQISSNP
jgi:hypothetical protein